MKGNAAESWAHQKMRWRRYVPTAAGKGKRLRPTLWPRAAPEARVACGGEFRRSTAWWRGTV